MPMTNAGALFLAKRIIDDTVQAFDESAAHIGVGNATTAFSISQEDLQGASKFRKIMDVGFPTRTNNVLTFRARFQQSEANFDWNEWGIFNAGVAGDMLLREVESLGTKTSEQVWQFTVTVTVVPGA